MVDDELLISKLEGTLKHEMPYTNNYMLRETTDT